MRLPGVPCQVSQRDQDLDDLVLKAALTEADVEQVAALNRAVHGAPEAAAVRYWLLDGHPQIDRRGWLFVADRASGRAVATLGLIPLTWRYGPAPLPVAELGFVATHPDYRRRGLQRLLSAAFDRIALANNYSLAGIEGIPYFYRQFGYEYALPLGDSRFRLRPDQVPAGELAPFVFRPATESDLPHLAGLFERANAGLAITTRRAEAMWRYYLHLMASGPPAPTGELSGLRLSAIEVEGRTMGYVALMPSGWANRLNVMELAAEDEAGESPEGAMVLAALRFARQQAEAGRHEEIGLQLPASHPACHLARSLGIKEEGTYGWQMKVLDPVAFLNAIAPALEARLAASPLAGSSGRLNWNLYRSRVGLVLEAGRVRAIPLDEAAEANVSLPPTGATQLWLGWRSFAALDDWYKDAWAWDEAHPLIDVLFPPAEAHIYLGY